MGLFGKRGGRGRAVRDQFCVYNGEPFPQRGEQMDLGAAGVCEIIVDRSDLPATWTGSAELVRAYTGEPRERAVLMNILGTLVAMMELSISNLGQMMEIPSHVEQVVTGMRGGDDQIGNVSYIFGIDAHGVDYFEFELVKKMSMLASPPPQQARKQRGWPYPDIWGGDATAFPYPY